MHRLLVFLLLQIVWIVSERKAFRERSKTPFRSLWVYLEKTRSPDPRWSLLHFATLSVLFFSLWEFLIRWALIPDDRFLSPSFVSGTLLWIVFLILRIPGMKLDSFNSGHEKIPGSLLWVMWLASCQLILGAWLSLVFLPWVFYRARFLKTSA